MNRTQSDQYWYNEGRRVGASETINKVLEIIYQETENIANGLCDVYEAYENVVDEVYALIEKGEQE